MKAASMIPKSGLRSCIVLLFSVLYFGPIVTTSFSQFSVPRYTPPPSAPSYTPPSIPRYTPPPSPSFQQFNMLQNIQRDTLQMNHNFRQQAYQSQMNNWQLYQNLNQAREMRDSANRMSLLQQSAQSRYIHERAARAAQSQVGYNYWRSGASSGDLRKVVVRGSRATPAGHHRQGLSVNDWRETTAAESGLQPTFGSVPVGTEFYFTNDLDKVFLWVKRTATVGNNLKNGRYAGIPQATPVAPVK